MYFKDEALRAFKLGILSLEERAQVRCRACTLRSEHCEILDASGCCTCAICHCQRHRSQL